MASDPALRCACPKCGTRLSVKDPALIDQRITCPRCEAPFVAKAEALPGKGSAVRQPRPTRPRDTEAEDDLFEQVPRKGRRKTSGGGGAVLLALGIVGLVVLVGGGVTLYVVLDKSGGPGRRVPPATNRPSRRTASRRCGGSRSRRRCNGSTREGR
jgi:hypothetical protein